MDLKPLSGWQDYTPAQVYERIAPGSRLYRLANLIRGDVDPLTGEHPDSLENIINISRDEENPTKGTIFVRKADCALSMKDITRRIRAVYAADGFQLKRTDRSHNNDWFITATLGDQSQEIELIGGYDRNWKNKPKGRREITLDYYRIYIL